MRPDIHGAVLLDFDAHGLASPPIMQFILDGLQ